MPESTSSQETPPEPPVPGGPSDAEKKKLSEIVIESDDMHEASTAQLKLMLAVKDEQIAQINLAHAAQARREAKEASDKVREEIEKKYDIDLMKFDIDEKTGKLMPKRQPAIDPALLQQLMGNRG